MSKTYFVCSASIFVLTACGQSTYDACLVEGLKGRANEALVEATEESCRRQYEIKKPRPSMSLSAGSFRHILMEVVNYMLKFRTTATISLL
jgi:hypothetical protein